MRRGKSSGGCSGYHALGVILAVGVWGGSLASGMTLEVQGRLLEVNDRSLVISKGGKTMEFSRELSTQMEGGPRPGDSVRVIYRAVVQRVIAPSSGKKAKRKGK